MFLLRHTICRSLSCCGCTARTCGARSSIALRVVDRHASCVIVVPMPPCTTRCGIDLQHRRAECAIRSLHGLLRAVAERDHRDHGRDADDDAEHREQRAEHVGAQRGQRDPE